MASAPPAPVGRARRRRRGPAPAAADLSRRRPAPSRPAAAAQRRALRVKTFAMAASTMAASRSALICSETTSRLVAGLQQGHRVLAEGAGSPRTSRPAPGGSRRRRALRELLRIDRGRRRGVGEQRIGHGTRREESRQRANSGRGAVRAPRAAPAGLRHQGLERAPARWPQGSFWDSRSARCSVSSRLRVTGPPAASRIPASSLRMSEQSRRPARPAHPRKRSGRARARAVDAGQPGRGGAAPVGAG